MLMNAVDLDIQVAKNVNVMKWTWNIDKFFPFNFKIMKIEWEKKNCSWTEILPGSEMEYFF
jgi:hypothetical protein